MSEEPVERFRPTSGRALGVLTLLLACGVVVIGVVERDRGFPPPVVAGAVLFGVLVWASLLRPGVWMTEQDLVLRNMLDTVTIPLTAIERVTVRQVLAVRAGDQSFVSPAIGRSLRQNLRPSGAGRRGAGRPPGAVSYPVFVEERIVSRAEDARARAGAALSSDEQAPPAGDVRRTWAWPEIVALLAASAAFVVTLLP